MAKSRSTFGKRDREMAKAAKASAKRARREERSLEEAEPTPTLDSDGSTADQLVIQLREPTTPEDAHVVRGFDAARTTRRPHRRLDGEPVAPSRHRTAEPARIMPGSRRFHGPCEADGVRYRRMPIEIESPEQLGYDTITNNPSESSVADRRLSDLGLDP